VKFRINSPLISYPAPKYQTQHKKNTRAYDLGLRSGYVNAVEFENRFNPFCFRAQPIQYKQFKDGFIKGFEMAKNGEDIFAQYFIAIK
jgi:hypothetical protein